MATVEARRVQLSLSSTRTRAFIITIPTLMGTVKNIITLIASITTIIANNVL
jgi:hypothetical protein